MTLLKGHNSTKGNNPDLKIIRVNYFLMRNPYMKFQNCILINFVTDARTDAHTDKLKAIYTPSTFRGLGHKNDLLYEIEAPALGFCMYDINCGSPTEADGILVCSISVYCQI